MAKLVKDNKCLEEFDYEGFMNQVKAEISSTRASILELAFPIGASYVTQTDINPASVLGFGTWERIKGKVLVGLDEDDENFNTIGKEGGEATHTLTVEEMPSHSHTYTKTDVTLKAEYDREFDGYGADNYFQNDANTNSVGGDKAHNNLQPYKVIGYMWTRTA